MKVSATPQGIKEDLTSYEFLTTRTEDVQLIMNQVADLICPIGVPLPYFTADNTIPTNFIELNGLWYPSNDYPLLAAKYGPYFGYDFTQKLFKTPDMNGVYFPSLTFCPSSIRIQRFITRAR